MYVRDFDLFATVHVVGDTRSVLSLHKLWKIMVILVSGIKDLNQMSSKNKHEKYIATLTTMLPLLFLVSRAQLLSPVRQVHQSKPHHRTPFKETRSRIFTQYKENHFKNEAQHGETVARSSRMVTGFTEKLVGALASSSGGDVNFWRGKPLFLRSGVVQFLYQKEVLGGMH